VPLRARASFSSQPWCTRRKPAQPGTAYRHDAGNTPCGSPQWPPVTCRPTRARRRQHAMWFASMTTSNLSTDPGAEQTQEAPKRDGWIDRSEFTSRGHVRVPRPLLFMTTRGADLAGSARTPAPSPKRHVTPVASAKQDYVHARPAGGVPFPGDRVVRLDLWRASLSRNSARSIVRTTIRGRVPWCPTPLSAATTSSRCHRSVRPRPARPTRKMSHPCSRSFAAHHCSPSTPRAVEHISRPLGLHTVYPKALFRTTVL
jgi:hypothetical protein